MKLLITLSLIFTMASVALAQNQNVTNPPPPDVKSVSYALGVNLGLSLSNTLRFLDATNVDIDVLAGAVKEVLAGQTPHMTKQEATAVTNGWGMAQRRTAAEINLAAGRAYLADYAKQPGVVTLSNGISYKVLKEGDGPKPGPTDTVTVNYRGLLVDGKEFDSSYSRNQPWDTQVNRVIRGWQEVLPMMKVGSKWAFVVPTELAYGQRGVPSGGIGPNSILIYDELELLAIKSTGPTATNSPPGRTNAPAGR